ncbi:MAG: chemotaxis protein CheB [Acetobacteraceae bacterium]|nr:chemotaxis protein CheB [Acetobacteraceae bacterium]
MGKATAGQAIRSTVERPKALIVIGTSSGGLAALRAIAAGLSPKLPAAICVIQHIGDHASHLPSLLDSAGPLRVVEAKDGDPLEAGVIYVAPPSHHLVVESEHLHLTRGPRENFARPAIDPLFRSAAEHFGSRAIGVVLTGQLNDGTAGLYEIKRRGGIAIVQDPLDAEYPSMPQSAADHVAIDHRVAAVNMPSLLEALVTKITRSSPSVSSRAQEMEMGSQLPHERPIAFTCPECGGSLRRSELGKIVKFDCHIGHSMTAEVMAAGQFAEMEKGLEASLRRMNERIELCRQMAEQAHAIGDEHQTRNWKTAMLQTEERAKVVSQLLQESWLQPQEGGIWNRTGI